MAAGPRQITNIEEAWDELVYHEDALSLDPLTADLAPTVAPLLVDRGEVVQQKQDARRQVLRAQAVYNNVNYRADKGVTDFAWSIRSVDQNKKTRLQRYFKIAPSKMVQRALAFMAKTMKSWIGGIAAEPEAEIQRHAPILDGLADEASNAVVGVAQAKGGVKDVDSQAVKSYLDRVNAYRLKLQGQLQQRASDNGLNAEWVDKFFKPSATRTKKRATEDTTVTEESPT
jgi:hypothetical protein